MILCPVRGPLLERPTIDDTGVRITQGFAENPDIYKQFGLKGHNGVDLAGPQAGDKVPIYAPYDGLVWKVRRGNKGYGNNVVLLTDKGGDGLQREVILAHLDSIDSHVEEGSRVYLGEKIGIMGTTGFSTGVHLHLGLRRRNLDMTVKDYDNGYFGYVDFEQYLLYWT